MSTFESALAQTWQPFVLILGLILIGLAAASDGLFESVGARLASLPGGGVTLFISMMGLVAVVTATLNLDTSVVFLTPIVLHAARQRAIDERAFLYGSIFMANAASLLLLGSNLTNILVFTGRNVRGVRFSETMLLPWASSVVLTTVVVMIWCWRELRTGCRVEQPAPPAFRFGVGFIGLCAATLMMLVLGTPALPVLVVGVLAQGIQIVVSRRSTVAATLRVANLALLASLFSIAIAIAVVARLWEFPSRLMASAGTWESAAVGAGTANIINNLPAAALLSSKLPAHPYALLIGLDLGPNLAVFGAMSSLLWLRIARQNNAKPSLRTFSAVGVVVTASTFVAAMLQL